MRATHFRTMFLSSTLALCLLFPAAAAAQQAGDNAPGFEDSAQGTSPGFDATAHKAATRIAWDGIDLPSAKLDLSDEKIAAELKKRHGVKLDPDKHIAFKGFFTIRHKESPELAIIDTEKNQLRVMRAAAVVAKRSLELPSKEELEALGAPELAHPTVLAKDGLMEILVWRKETSKENRTTFKLTGFKVVGKYIGHVIDQPVAQQTSDTLVTTHVVDIYQHEGKPAFGITPVGSDNTLGQQRFLLWDRFEGVFHAPMTPPTAPKHDTSRS